MIKFVKEATDVEIESMKINDAWDLERLPPDKRAIFCKWTFNIEIDGRCKMCFVDRDFMKKNYSLTIFPGISIRVLYLILLILNDVLHAFALHVKKRFPDGELNEFFLWIKCKVVPLIVDESFKEV